MLARNCTGRKFCFEVPQSGKVSIPIDDLLFFTERMYVNPITHIGSSESEIISPFLIHYAPILKEIWERKVVKPRGAVGFAVYYE